MNQSPINLNKALRLIFPLEEIIWLSNEKKTDLMVKWFCLDVGSAQPGDALLLPVGDVNPKSLKEANEKGIEVVLLIGQRRDLKIFSFPLPILLVETKEDFRQVQRKLFMLFTNAGDALNERKLQVHTQLSRLAADGLGLEDLAQAIYEITRHGVLIQDKRLNMIAGVPSADLHTFWEDITDQLSEIDSLPKPLRDRQQAGDQSSGITQQLKGGISRVIVPITVSNVARGYLSVIGTADTIDVLDHLAAEEGALICAIDMSRAKAVRETEKKLQSDLLTALLQENLSPRDAKLWVDAMGFDQSQAHAALQFIWDSPNPPSRRRLETLINGEVIRMGIKIILNPAGDAVICFCQIPPNETGHHVALEFGKNVFEQAKREFPKDPIRCGVGSPATDLNQWHVSFREAGLALDMATRLSKDVPLYYPDLSVHRLLMLLEDNPELEVFQNDILGSLLEHEGKSNYIDTLEAYFEQSGNLSRTAEALFIHRNTLNYRMERIAEISRIDLTNPETALAVQLALKIYRMMKGRDKNM